MNNAHISKKDGHEGTLDGINAAAHGLLLDWIAEGRDGNIEMATGMVCRALAIAALAKRKAAYER